MREEEIKALLNTFPYALSHLTDCAENSNEEGYNLHSSIAELIINNKKYQIQVSFITEESAWVDENGVQSSEIIKK